MVKTSDYMKVTYLSLYENSHNCWTKLEKFDHSIIVELVRKIDWIRVSLYKKEKTVLFSVTFFCFLVVVIHQEVEANKWIVSLMSLCPTLTEIRFRNCIFCSLGCYSTMGPK